MERYCLDVSTLFLVDRYSTGIPRTIYEFSKFVMEDANYVYLRFLPEIGFTSVSRSELKARIEILKGKGVSKVAHRNKKPIALRVKMKIERKLGIGNKKRGVTQFEFCSSDKLLSFGAGWNNEQEASHIKKLKSIGVKYYLMIYDLIPYYGPHLFPEHIRVPYNAWLNSALMESDKVFCISANTSKDVLRYLDENSLHKMPIEIVRLGDDIGDFNIDLVREDIVNLTKEKFVLAVGTLQFRKNQHLLLGAWRTFAERGLNVPNLILVGRTGWLHGEIHHHAKFDPRINKTVKIISDASDDELGYLYSKCLFTLNPSIYEGWGLPAAESLLNNKVTLVANNTSIIEVWSGEGVIPLDPFNQREWEHAILDLCNSPEKLLAKEDLIKAKYAPTTWENFSEKLSQSISFPE